MQIYNINIILAVIMISESHAQSLTHRTILGWRDLPNVMVVKDKNEINCILSLKVM